MRILRIHPTVPPYPGGLENHVAELSRQQRLSGHTVTVAFNEGAPTSPDDIRLLPNTSLARVRPQALRDIRFAMALRQRLRQSIADYDVVHVHGDWSAFLAISALAGAKRTQIKIASIHGGIKQGLLAKAIYRRSLAFFDIVYTTGRREAQELKEGCRREIAWMTSGLDPSWLQMHETKKDIDVLCVGTLTAVKNFVQCIAVARALPQFRFVVVGEGPDRAQLERLANDVRNVEFFGHLKHRELLPIYRRSRVFLSTSLSEGTPTAILEAMATGLPIVATEANDYSLLFDDSGGRIARNDSQEIGQALLFFLSDEKARQIAGSANAQRARLFCWPEIARRLNSLIHETALAKGYVIDASTHQ